MLDIQHGEVFEQSGGSNIGVRIAITNLFWKEDDGSTSSDASLLLMRRSFGMGRMNITLQRKDAYLVREAGHLQFMAQNAATHLFGGSASSFDVAKIASLIEDNVDALVNHPPESEAKMIKRKQRQMQLDGLVIVENGVTVVDAR